MKGMAQINLRDVAYSEDLMGVPISRRWGAIKTTILARRAQRALGGGGKGKQHVPEKTNIEV